MEAVRIQTAWVLAIRPKTLSASISPVILGSSFAWKMGEFSFLIFFLTLLFALSIQIGANLANDYYDFLKGADNQNRLGPIRVCQKGLIKPDTVRKAFLMTFFFAFLFGVPLALKGGLGIWILLILSISFGILYTAGPYPLAYLGLGDLFVLLFFGPLASQGTYYLQTSHISIPAIFSGLGCGLISCAILAVNNVRDIEEDRFANKKTLPVRFSATFGKCQYALCLLFASFLPIFFFGYLFTSLMISLANLLLAYPLIRTMFVVKDPMCMNVLLAKTAKFLGIYSLLFSLGILFT